MVNVFYFIEAIENRLSKVGKYRTVHVCRHVTFVGDGKQNIEATHTHTQYDKRRRRRRHRSLSRRNSLYFVIK